MGDPFRSIFVIRSGSLKTVRFESEEGQQILGFHLPGEVVGLDGMADDRHHCDALALERSSVCAVTMDTLERTAAQLPSLQRQLHRIMGREMGHDQAHVAAMGRRSARERLALFLYDLSQRMVQSGQSGLAFRLPMSRDDLANYLGLALETVSRLFNQLADEGIITIDRRRIRIDRPEALTELAGMSEDRPSERSSTS